MTGTLLEVRDLRVEAEPPGHLADPVGEARGVEAAGVADDPHPPLERQAEALRDAIHSQLPYSLHASPLQEALPVAEPEETRVDA